MSMILRILLGLCITFLSIRLGWPWPVLLVPAYAFIMALTLPTTQEQARSSSFPVTRDLALFVALFLLVSILVGGAAGNALFALDKAQNPLLTGSPRPQDPLTYRLLFGTPAIKVFWAALIGCVAGWIVVVAGVMSVFSRRQWPIEAATRFREKSWLGFYMALTAVLGISRGTWIVGAGESKILADPTGTFATLGGPGVLQVQEAHAVVLERSGAISRVVGRGRHWLRAFERVSMIVPLYARTERVTVEDAPTADRVPVKQIEFIVFHKADTGPLDECAGDGLSRYNERIIRDLIWSADGDDWRKGVKGVTETSARDVIGRHKLEDLVPMSDAGRSAFKAELLETINLVTKDKMGVKCIAVDMGKISVPDESVTSMLSWWLAQYERETAVWRAETDAQVQEKAAASRAQSITTLADALRDMLKDPNASDDMISLRFIEYLEQQARNHGTQVEDPVTILARLQNIKSLRGESRS